MLLTASGGAAGGTVRPIRWFASWATVATSRSEWRRGGDSKTPVFVSP
jgi:hypothetical protein